MAGGAVDLLGEDVGKSEATRTKRGRIPAWAERYGYGERQIKNWLADGKEAGDPVPLDSPGEMAAWFEGRYSKKVPARLLEAIEKLTGTKPAGSTSGEGVKRSEKELEPFEMPSIDEHELGIEQQLDSYRRKWLMLEKLHMKALHASDFSRASNYFGQQKEVSAEIRQLERLMPTVLEQRGDFQRTSEVRNETVGMLKVLQTSLIGHGVKCAPRLRAAANDAEWAAAWRQEMEEVFRRVCGRKFAAEFELAAS